MATNRIQKSAPTATTAYKRDANMTSQLFITNSNSANCTRQEKEGSLKNLD